MYNKNNGQRSASLEKNLICYFAGIIDGEGYVTIKRSYLKRKTNNKTYQYYVYTPVIAIAMTSQDFMVWMKKTLPYNGRLWVRKFKNPNWRDSYTVSFHNRNAIELAELLLPESRIKKKQLKILAKYPIGGARTITTPEREKLYWQMREENKKSRQQQRLSEETLRNLNSKIQ